MGGNAVLLICTPFAKDRLLPIQPNTYRQKLDIPGSWVISSTRLDAPLHLQNETGTRHSLSPGTFFEWQDFTLYYETSSSLGHKLENSSWNNSAEIEYLEKMALVLEPAHSMFFARYFQKKSCWIRSMFHAGRGIGSSCHEPIKKNRVSDYLFLLIYLTKEKVDPQFIDNIFQAARMECEEHPALFNWFKSYRKKHQAMRALSLVFAEPGRTAIEQTPLHSYHCSAFKLFFPPATDLKWIGLCRDTLFKAMNQLNSYMHAVPFYEVYLAELEQAEDVMKGAFYNGRIFINLLPLLKEGDIQVFRNTVKHEYIHLLNHQFVKSDKNRILPRWLDEGLAYVLAGNLHLTHRAPVQDINILESRLQIQLNRSVDLDALSAASQLVEYLISMQTEEKLTAARQVLENWSVPGKEQEINRILKLVF
ncbi:MAG: hypothetical protein CSA81_05760 [Acidobacteria bacterium]|nr:MAG: hypothetical protein CSA81_05760 [Acidobacteriota bacterium]